MIHLSYFRCLNSDGNIPCSACLFLSIALRWDQGDKLKYRHLPDHMNPTHQISRASTPHFPLYGAATQTFPLLTSCVCWVRLWRNAVWGCQGGVTSARRAWLDTGGFCHMADPDAFCRATQCCTDSWVTPRRKSVLCLQKIALHFFSFQAGSYDHDVRDEWNFFLLLFLAWENNSSLASSLPLRICRNSLVLFLPVMQSNKQQLRRYDEQQKK